VGASCFVPKDGQTDMTKLTVVLHNLRKGLKTVDFRCTIILHIILVCLARCIIHVNGSASVLRDHYCIWQLLCLTSIPYFTVLVKGWLS